MKKVVSFLFCLIFLQYMVFCESEISEHKADLNFDGIEDVLIEDSHYDYSLEDDVLKGDVRETIKLFNEDGSINRKIQFSEAKKLNVRGDRPLKQFRGDRPL